MFGSRNNQGCDGADLFFIVFGLGAIWWDETVDSGSARLFVQIEGARSSKVKRQNSAEASV